MVGSDEVIRVSSVIAPFLIGTLKSTRMKTRLPRRSRSLIEYLVITVGRAKARRYSFLSRSTQRLE